MEIENTQLNNTLKEPPINAYEILGPIIEPDSNWKRIRVYESLPNLIKSILLTSEGWLVGSGPENMIYGGHTRDYDILVPSRELYQITCAQLRTYDPKVSLNTFGGLKFKLNNLEIDLWPEELGHFIMTAIKCKYAYNLKRSKLIEQL